MTPPIPPCNDDRLEMDPGDSLTPQQRACFLLNDLSAPSAIFGAAFGAAFGRLTNTDPSTFGTGAPALGLGILTRYTQSATKSSAEYLAAWIAHDDPRRRRHRGTGPERFRAAAAALLVSDDAGPRHFRPAPLAGAVSGGFIALLWEDRNRTTVHQATTHTLTSLGASFVWLEFHEFEPELMRWISNRLEPKLR